MVVYTDIEEAWWQKVKTSEEMRRAAEYQLEMLDQQLLALDHFENEGDTVAPEIRHELEQEHDNLTNHVLNDFVCDGCLACGGKRR